MAWTTGKLTENGWYWVRWPGSKVKFIVLVSGDMLSSVFAIDGQTDKPLDQCPVFEWQKVADPVVG